MENQKEKKELKGKALIMEALTSSIAFYRTLERAFFQEKSKKIANRIGFLKIAIKELEKLKE